jgi:glutamate synthase domain-containing protein 2/glutamate synthase domain-containing protein 1/glutamate synthase domain-containing protein 3
MSYAQHFSDRTQRHAPLYDAALEHDACGVGLVVDIKGRPSREIVERALGGLVNLTHRGGVGADARTGDGAGVLTQIPHALFTADLARLGAGDLAAGGYGVAMCFLPKEQAAARELIERAFADRGLGVIGWREVPVDSSVLGEIAAQTQPEIAQLFVRKPESMDAEAFERELMLARRGAERAAEAAGSDLAIVSCSARTVIYKAFSLPEDLALFYSDLRDPAYVSAIALFHQRYSTNTLPTWAMAQPFRFIAHNGEINTVQGNRNWMMARASGLALSDVPADELTPVLSLTGSDSLSLDNTLELLHHGGRSLPHALMMLVPEPWEQLPEMDPARRAFYDFNAGLMEQWDGPAALAFSDGVLAGATLDRNGLRPLRYAITEDGLLIAGSEAGTVEMDQARIVEKGRLGPGQMIVVDTARGAVLYNDDVKAEIAESAPYQEWLDAARIKLEPGDGLAATIPVDDLVSVQRAFGYHSEDARLIVQPMAVEGKEPVWSMGDDAPLAVLSEKARPLSSYFRQRFAQVTNPPIDSLREKRVMALDSYLGPRRNLLMEEASQAALVHLPSVAITEAQLETLATLDQGALKGAKLSTLFAPEGPDSLEAALDALVANAEAMVRDGVSILVLTDRGVDAEHAPLPMLLAVGAIHHHLIRAGLRMKTDLVCETGEVWDVHHLATLIGYGASAVHPYLALTAAGNYAGTRGNEDKTVAELQATYLHSLDYAMLKTTSKMGISTAMGYRGAQIFEAIGLDKGLVERCFAGTPSRLGGITLKEVGEDVIRRHGEAFGVPMAKLPDPGFARFRKDGESHAFNPTAVKALQAATSSNNLYDFQAYRDLIDQHPLTAVRDLIEIKPLGPAVPLDAVEPAEDIVQRFVVTAMSLGALSPEAFRTLAIAMNRIGARSNSGEGGEDPAWYDETGPDIAHSKIKQVASGRFGVTARYLAMASELEIKMAQGSKPGEGGQLPNHKVTGFIARIRHAVPGLPLISPPPHHDIYSIEDLAQLIYDLRQVNPRAKIGVKLVSEAGVGTIAAGVAKARADYILVSGHSGGTGASPLASIKHAGGPWELGIAETQQTLVMNGLRSRVRLRTDGGIKRPEDVVMAAMFGAEEYGFGTSALVAIGCDMARQCHLNTCPTGIATQKEELRRKFAGTPEMAINYFMMLAEGVREVLASLGATSLDQVIGRTDLLAQKPLDGRAGLLDLSSLFPAPAAENERKKSIDIEHDAETLDRKILAIAGPAIAEGQSINIHEEIATPDRTVGATIAGEIALHHGAKRLPAGTVTAQFTGSAGQSFGAFTVDGMRLILEGEANDYVGKGMSGGEIAIFPPRHAKFTEPQVIAGNTILYGATGGSLFLAGRAGERFAVRNSGASAVVEGVGEHGCEYMTGGVAVILGPTGRNFGAGMTNGLAYVYDPEDVFEGRVNDDSVLLERIEEDADADRLYDLIERHVKLTHSAHAKRLLSNWDQTLAAFWRVVPRATLALVAPIEEPAIRQGAAD